MRLLQKIIFKWFQNQMKKSLELKFHTGIEKFLGQIQALKKLAKYDTNHGV